jgi:hypothetical protein
LKLIDDRPDLYLDELIEDLSETLRLSPSLSTVQRTIKLVGYTTKKVHGLYFLFYYPVHSNI